MLPGERAGQRREMFPTPVSLWFKVGGSRLQCALLFTLTCSVRPLAPDHVASEDCLEWFCPPPVGGAWGPGPLLRWKAFPAPPPPGPGGASLARARGHRFRCHSLKASRLLCRGGEGRQFSAGLCTTRTLSQDVPPASLSPQDSFGSYVGPWPRLVPECQGQCSHTRSHLTFSH